MYIKSQICEQKSLFTTQTTNSQSRFQTHPEMPPPTQFCMPTSYHPTRYTHNPKVHISPCVHPFHATLRKELVRARFNPTDEHTADILLDARKGQTASARLPVLKKHKPKVIQCHHQKCLTCRHLNTTPYFKSSKTNTILSSEFYQYNLFAHLHQMQKSSVSVWPPNHYERESTTAPASTHAKTVM